MNGTETAGKLRGTYHQDHAYDDTYGKLSSGRGNLMGHAQKLRQLGVKPSKSLAPAVDGAYETDELPFVWKQMLR